MAEINIKLTERQARYVLLEMERIAENSDDDGYRHIAEDICRRIRKASSRPTPVVADDALGEICGDCLETLQHHLSNCVQVTHRG